MTELDLTTLSARIRDHKRRLVEIVKPPVCTERARHYTESYQANIDKPIVVRRALALAHHHHHHHHRRRRRHRRQLRLRRCRSLRPSRPWTRRRPWPSRGEASP